MKLKKIASLMLAGIMAVSMLAGCKGSDTTNEEQENPVVPSASKLADLANDELTGAQEKVFSFHDNGTLNTALEAVATDKSKVNATMISSAFDTTVIEFLTGRNDTLSGEVVKKFTTGTYADAASEWTTWINAIPGNAEKKDAYIEVSVMSGLMTEEGVAKAVVDRWATHMNTATFATTSSNYDLSYSADISAVKVSNSNDASKTAWVVAVMINKTATESKNAVV